MAAAAAIPTPTTNSAALATAASIAATAVLIRTLSSDLVPSGLQDYISSTFSSILARLSTDLTIIVDELDGPYHNTVYKAAETYLAAKLPRCTRRIRVTMHDEDEDESALEVAIDRGQDIVDVFNGVKFRWRLTFKESLPRRRLFRNQFADSTAYEARFFELTIGKKHKDIALRSYIPYVVSQAKLIKEEAKALKLHSNNNGTWDCVNLRHPATFDTMAMDDELKREVMEDLTRFVKRKEYYKRVGKAWKRGYLLYGPPGTGKSSLVAAMANYLKFNVYDLELTEVTSNSGLRSLLVATTNRSILVVEDIDCAADITLRESNRGGSSSDDDKVTLSGVLNFVDGLWSSIGDERIIVFTTNHKDRLDPALLRPGRMDMHIHMGYCTPAGFRVLASNYHCLDGHPLFVEIEGLIAEVEMTPAGVAEELMKTDNAEVALQGLIKALKKKKKSTNTNEAEDRMKM